MPNVTQHGGRQSQHQCQLSALSVSWETGSTQGQTHICKARCSPGGVCGPSWCPPECTWWQRSGRKSRRSCCHCCIPVGKAEISPSFPKPFTGTTIFAHFTDGDTKGQARNVISPRSDRELVVELQQEPTLGAPRPMFSPC